MVGFWIFIFIVTYVAAFFLLRYAYKCFHKLGFWVSLDARMDWLWWVPLANLLAVPLVFGSLGLRILFDKQVMAAKLKPKRKWNNATWKWLTNQHLRG